MNLDDYGKIIIYQFGKVGSETLHHTFKHYSKAEVQHTHDFNDLIELKTTKPVLIINVVRNLFDRNISAMFQNIQSTNTDKGKNNYVREGYFLQNQPLLEDFRKGGDIEKVSDFFRKVNTEILLKSIFNRWYSDFNKHTEIDIFETPFNNDEKYKIIPGCNKTILVLRFEDIKQWENTLSNIFNQKISLKSKNITSEKPIHIFQEKFKKHYKYSEEEIKMIKNIDFMKHFYTEDEINEKIKKYELNNFVLDKNKKVEIDDRCKFKGSGFDEKWEIGECSIAYQIIPFVKNVIEIGGGTGKVSHTINSILNERNLQKKHIVIEPGLRGKGNHGNKHLYTNKDFFKDEYTIINKLADELTLEDIQNVFENEKPNCLFVDCEGCLYSFQKTKIGKYILDNVKYIINEMDGNNQNIREQWKNNDFEELIIGYGCETSCTTEIWKKIK